MSNKHWKAVSDVPTTMGGDWMSIIYYAFISWSDDQIKAMLRTGGYSPYAYYLSDGLRDTIKQDYMSNLLGLGGELEGEGLGARFFY